MKSFSDETLKKVVSLLHFGSCENCMNTANLVAELAMAKSMKLYSQEQPPPAVLQNNCSEKFRKTQIKIRPMRFQWSNF